MKNQIILSILFVSFLSFSALCQDNAKDASSHSYSKVEITGDANLVFEAKGSELRGKIGFFADSTKIRLKEFEGSVYMNLYPEGKKISENIGTGVALIKIYEYDFGGDGENEILLINEYGAHTMCYVYTYKGGKLERIFEHNLQFYKTVISPDNIEHNVGSPANTIWEFSYGEFLEAPKD